MCIYLEAVGVVFYFEVEINKALEIGNASATWWVVQSLSWTAQWYVYYGTGNVVFVLYYLLPAKLTCPHFQRLEDLFPIEMVPLFGDIP